MPHANPRSSRPLSILAAASPGGDKRAGVWAAAALIAGALAAAYAGSFNGPLIFDDGASIKYNPTIRRIWPPAQVFSPPCHGETVSGRPVLNLSLALNYRFGGTNVWGYHALNLAIHFAAALLLMGILRRTLEMVDGGRGAVDGQRWTLNGVDRTVAPEISRPTSTPPSTIPRPPSVFPAFAVALLWALHPLQTESVTYIIQRAESLTGMFYLLTLYCVIRGAASARAVAWYAAAVLACLAGMATKEVMVTAPLLVLLYDRTFLASSLEQSLRRRWGLYLGLAATWGLLTCLVLSTNLRGGTAGYGAPLAAAAGDYLRSQPAVILYYLRLAIWPHPLCLDYGPQAMTESLKFFGPATIVVALLLAAAAWGLIRRKSWALLGAWWFLILAPSSLVPLRDVAFEHRVYLPLAAVATALVVGGYRAGPWLGRKGLVASPTERVAAVCLVLVASGVLGVLTFRRNLDYQSDLRIWQDTVAKAPLNDCARNNLGAALVDGGRVEEAIPHYRKALQIRPDYAEAHNNCANALALLGKADDAVFHYQRALEIRPDYAEAHSNFGLTLARQGKVAEAIAHCRRALEIDPENLDAHTNLGIALAREERLPEAVAQFRKALELDPGVAEIHKDLGIALYHQGNTRQALAQWREVIRLQSGATAVLNTAAWALATDPDPAVRNGAEAVELAQRAVALTGGRDPAVLDTLGAAYAEAGRFAESVQTARQALTLAERSPQPALAEKISAHLKLYQAGTPYREAVPCK